MVANGFLPSSALTTVQGSIQLPDRAAQSWFALEAAVRSHVGVDLNITSPAGGYRSYDMQVAMYRDPAAYGAKPGKVAAPGNSVHGTLPGCVDIYNWAVLGTLRMDAFARQFGWRRTITSEPWHYQYDGVTASTAGGGSGSGGGAVTSTTRRLAMTARFLVAPGPLWAGIDLVAFRSQGGVIVTDKQGTAEDLSRVYPFPAEEVTREELNNSVIAARLWVEQVVNASIGTAAPVDPQALAAQLAPLLQGDIDDLTEAEFLAHLEAKVSEISANIAGVPAAVIVEQKKPGN